MIEKSQPHRHARSIESISKELSSPTLHRVTLFMLFCDSNLLLIIAFGKGSYYRVIILAGKLKNLISWKSLDSTIDIPRQLKVHC